MWWIVFYLISILVSIIVVMFVIGFVVGCCVGASRWLAWYYKVVEIQIGSVFSFLQMWKELVNQMWWILLYSISTLQKRLLLMTKLFRRLQKAIEKTSFFDGKSLSSTITHQILKHLWRQNEFVENAYYFCRKYDLFWRDVFPPYLLRWHKNVHR